MSRTTSYAYDLNGNVVVKSLSNGLEEKRTHDARNRVLTLNNGPSGGGLIADYAYTYDAVGNVTQIAETYGTGGLSGRTITNGYDGTYRLTSEAIATTGSGTVSTAYAYDKGNNRTSRTVTGGSSPGTTTYTMGSIVGAGGANQLLSSSGPGGAAVSFTYDGNGNRKTRTAGGVSDAYSYDYEDRLVGLDYRTGSGSALGVYQYAYDYRTRRVQRTEPGFAPYPPHPSSSSSLLPPPLSSSSSALLTPRFSPAPALFVRAGSSAWGFLLVLAASFLFVVLIAAGIHDLDRVRWRGVGRRVWDVWAEFAGCGIHPRARLWGWSGQPALQRAGWKRCLQALRQPGRRDDANQWIRIDYLSGGV
jgi:YD repeat-containing protein